MIKKTDIHVVGPLSKEDLDANAQCGDPNCKGQHSPRILLTSPCHPGPLMVSYEKDSGKIDLRCAVCFGNLPGIYVGDRPPKSVAVTRDELVEMAAAMRVETVPQ